MKILPVIDLLGRQVVRGIAGQRERYLPIQSNLTSGAEPADVARAFAECFRFSEAYVADLDAIAGAEPAWDLYEQIADGGLRLWIDVGISRPEQVDQLANFQAAGQLLSGLIIALESVASPEVLVEIFQRVDPPRIVFSLDLKNGRLLTSSPAWESYSPEQVVQLVGDQAVERLIVLDLARVGMSQGTGTGALCESLSKRYPEMQLISGGGINSLDDLRLLSKSGCSSALIASALHDGRLTSADLEIAQEF